MVFCTMYDMGHLSRWVEFGLAMKCAWRAFTYTGVHICDHRSWIPSTSISFFCLQLCTSIYMSAVSPLGKGNVHVGLTMEVVCICTCQNLGGFFKCLHSSHLTSIFKHKHICYFDSCFPFSFHTSLPFLLCSANTPCSFTDNTERCCYNGSW